MQRGQKEEAAARTAAGQAAAAATVAVGQAVAAATGVVCHAAAAATVVVGQAAAAAAIAVGLEAAAAAIGIEVGPAAAAAKKAEGSQGTFEAQGSLCRKAQAVASHSRARQLGAKRCWCRPPSQLRSAGTSRSVKGETGLAYAELQEGLGLAKVGMSGRRGESQWRGDPGPRPCQKE